MADAIVDGCFFFMDSLLPSNTIFDKDDAEKDRKYALQRASDLLKRVPAASVIVRWFYHLRLQMRLQQPLSATVKLFSEGLRE
jgi:hypothetical protein